jgi:hypothetical protein
MENMKISRFCWGMNLSDAASSLAISGMVMSVLGLIGGAITSAIPFIVHSFFYKLLVLVLGMGATLLLINAGWFYFSYQLYKRKSNNDAQGVKKIIKIGSYIIGSLQAIGSAIGLLSGITLLALATLSAYGGFSEFRFVLSQRYPTIFNPLGLTIVGGIWMIFSSLLLHGIRTKNHRIINLWIVFIIVIFCLQLWLCVVWSLKHGMIEIIVVMIQVIVMDLLCSYSTGIVIVHYNIVLEDQNVPDLALENISNENPSKIDMNSMMTDVPPPYSQVV